MGVTSSRLIEPFVPTPHPTVPTSSGSAGSKLKRWLKEKNEDISVDPTLALAPMRSGMGILHSAMSHEPFAAISSSTPMLPQQPSASAGPRCPSESSRVRKRQLRHSISLSFTSLNQLATSYPSSESRLPGGPTLGPSSSLYDAARHGFQDLVELLLAEYPEHVNARGEREMTPMHGAALGGHANILRLLQRHGADVGSRNKYGETPLHAASWSGKLDAGQCLLDLGADINARNEDDWTPLFHAIFHGHAEFARMLLERGAAIEARSVFRSTALHAAVRGGDVQAARLLLEHGADVNARDSRGWAPCQCNSTLGQEMVELLAEFGIEFGKVRESIGSEVLSESDREDDRAPRSGQASPDDLLKPREREDCVGLLSPPSSQPSPRASPLGSRNGSATSLTRISSGFRSRSRSRNTSPGSCSGGDASSHYSSH